LPFGLNMIVGLVRYNNTIAPIRYGNLCFVCVENDSVNILRFTLLLYKNKKLNSKNKTKNNKVNGQTVERKILMKMKVFNLRTLDHLSAAKEVQSLGSGGFANVYRYKCIQNHPTGICDKCYVVKSLKIDEICFRNKDDMIEQIDATRSFFYNEYNIGRDLLHDNIIRVIDMDVVGTSIVLEDFTGIDLLDYLNLDETTNVPLMIKLFTQILDAVDYMHTKKGIAHMDIKLENIIWNRETNILKLIDFGHARIFRKDGEELAYYNGHCGTESYFPPEYFDKDYYLPSKVDAWCCGVSLYNLIYDKMPWELACAHTNDEYADYKNCLDYGLSINHIFKDMTKYGISRADASYVWTVLVGLLNPDSKRRFSIKKASELLKFCSFMK